MAKPYLVFHGNIDPNFQISGLLRKCFRIKYNHSLNTYFPPNIFSKSIFVLVHALPTPIPVPKAVITFRDADPRPPGAKTILASDPIKSPAPTYTAPFSSKPFWITLETADSDGDAFIVALR